jgi:hypothetical protein
MGVIKKIKVQFGVLGTGDPRYLKLDDMSSWSYIADKPAIVEITLPAYESPLTFDWTKNAVNEFNSTNLLAKCTDCTEDTYLPDGIYEITLKGSPSTYFYTLKYLKTDTVELKLDAAILAHEEYSTTFKTKVVEAIFLLRAARANVKFDNTARADSLMTQLLRLVKEIENCK